MSSCKKAGQVKSRYSDQALFELIRKRPGMYIGSPVNVRMLFQFWSGYRFALLNNHLNDHEGFLSNCPTFHDWVAMKEGYYESTSG